MLQILTRHIRDNICAAAIGGAPFKYILDWMASGVQHPDDPGRSSLSMRGAPGCGQGCLRTRLRSSFWPAFFCTQPTGEHVTGKFNAHQAETCLIFVDEALYAEVRPMRKFSRP